MKNIIYIILLFISGVNAQNIVFSGTVFKNKLLQSSLTSTIAKDSNGNNMKIDANDDGEITQQEAALVFQLDVNNSSIVNLVGIDFFTNLTSLNCNQNNIVVINASNLINLVSLDASSNASLVSINLKNGTNENIILNDSNTSLRNICADESQVAALESSIPVSLNVIINDYCTLEPGGNYNTITGQILYDHDNNIATTNYPYPYVKLINNLNSDVFQTVSKETGNYNLFTTETGNYNLNLNLENASWFNITTATGIFLDNNNNSNTHNFIISPNGIHHDVEISIRPIKTPLNILFANVTYEIVFKNKGTQPRSGQLSVNFNQLVLGFLSSTLPVNVGLGSLTHNYANLLPFETRSFVISLTTLQLLNIGGIVQVNLSIDSTGETAANQNDNSYTYRQKVVSNNNPNRIECLEGDALPVSDIGKYLHYAINFENTGNQIAKNITIKTEFDASKYNMNSLQILKSTHALDLEIKNNIAYYKFRNANVGGPGGHGGILLKVKTNPDLPNGTTVSQGAEIYFDYELNDNPNLIITNNQDTVFGTLNVSINDFDNSISVYPNPTNSIIYVNSKTSETINNIELYDSLGRLLQTNITNTEQASIDLTQRANGVYFLKITSDNGQKVERIIKK